MFLTPPHSFLTKPMKKKLLDTFWNWSVLLVCATLSCFPPLTSVFWLCILIIHMGQGMEENEAQRRFMSRLQDANAVVFFKAVTFYR